MPIQAPQWTEFLSCPVCYNEFDGDSRSPVSLGCGHTVCRACLQSLHRKQCPFDQSHIRVDVLKVPANSALLRLVGITASDSDIDNLLLPTYNVNAYRRAVRCIEDLAMFLRPFTSGSVNVLSRPMQRKLVTLANCQLLESEGRARALRAARSLGERTVTELLLQHQNPQQLSTNLWAAVRARGCQFLGPAMQEEVLRLVLLALEDGTALSRKVLVMFVVQRLEPHYSQASKTSIGHVVQLLYRASCFKVSKREGDSSLMQLKDEFRSYEALRREHDAQIVQIATEAGLRIAPDQWSSLLYGDTTHKSHMQSIMDKLQTPQSFSQSVQELVMALQRSGDPGGLAPLRPHLEYLASIDPSPEAPAPTWDETTRALEAARTVVCGLADFVSHHGGSRRLVDAAHPSAAAVTTAAAKYKVSMCRDLTLRGSCPRGSNCTFAHSETELDRFRLRGRASKSVIPMTLTDERGLFSGGGFEMPSSPAPVFVGQGFVAPPVATGVEHWKGLRNVNLSPAQRYKFLVSGGQQQIDSGDVSADGFIHDFNNPYDNAIHCDSLMNVAAMGAPPWQNIAASSSKLPLDIQDVHYFIQPSQGIIDFNGQIQALEQNIFDLQLGESSRQNNNNNNNVVGNLRRLQDNLDEEELYEANIVEDMKEMEQRWECEWNEQERQWNEPDAESSKNAP